MTENQHNRDKGLIFNIQRFSIHDGPGIRTTVFMKGCPARCLWCSNPESILPTQEIMAYDIRCIRCGQCVDVCPEDAVSSIFGDQRIDPEKCTHCMACVTACPAKCLECVGQYMTVDDVVEEVEKDRLFYKNSNGGMTLSGGEPLLQWEFSKNLLEQCKAKGLSTALDTTGYAPWTIVEQVVKHADLVLYDVKHAQDQAHKEGTGISNHLIMENLEKIGSLKKRIWLRIPLIKGYNDDEKNLEAVALLARRVEAEKVSLLPYHDYSTTKYDKLGKKYTVPYPGKVGDDELEHIKAFFDKQDIVSTFKS